MIEYAKVILPKVIAWKNLFRKELKKCLDWLAPEELNELQNWCYENFYEICPDVISDMCASAKHFIEMPEEITLVGRINKHFDFKKLSNSALKTG